MAKVKTADVLAAVAAQMGVTVEDITGNIWTNAAGEMVYRPPDAKAEGEAEPEGDADGEDTIEAADKADPKPEAADKADPKPEAERKVRRPDHLTGATSDELTMEKIAAMKPSEKWGDPKMAAKINEFLDKEMANG